MISEKQIFGSNKFNLEQAQIFLDSWCKKNLIPRKISAKVLVCSDEIASNIVFYSGASFFEIECSKNDEQVFLAFTDDGIPFNPLIDSKEPDVTFSPEDRKIGGLGIFMVKKMACSTEYHRVDEKNIFKVSIALD